MSAKSAYFGAVVKSFLEIIYATKPSFYFTLAGMPELRKDNPEISAGELYAQCMLSLKGKHPRASTVHQMNTQQNKLMDEAMLRAARQKETSVDEDGRHEKLLSKLRNQNTIEEQEAETAAKALLLEDKRTIRILAFIVAACVLVTVILTVISAVI